MTEGRLYVLKVWPEPGRFRADLRAVNDIEVLRFEGVQRLCEHIASLAGAPAGAPDTDPTAPSAREEGAPERNALHPAPPAKYPGGSGGETPEKRLGPTLRSS